jgi:muramoyltetrapeptide carboxypeptidase
MSISFNKKFHLSVGDKIGIITPSSPINKENLKKAVTNVQSLGLEPEYLPSVLAREGFFAGSAVERAEEIHYFFKKSDIRAIMSVRGGYGSFETLGLLDYKLLHNYSKPLIGYSDSTALLTTVYQNSRIPVIHAPMALGGFSAYSAEQFKKLLFREKNSYSIQADKNKADSYCINPGEAKGVLLGGNLSVLCSLIGTDYDPNYADKILFLEEVNEPPYKIHRMLRQLEASGKLNKIKALVFGLFNACDNLTEKEKAENYSLKEVINQIAVPLKIPSAYGLPFGHTADSAALPIGLHARFNSENLELEIELQ